MAEINNLKNKTLFETVAIVDGRILNLAYHNRRFIEGQLFLGCGDVIDNLQPLIDDYLCNNASVQNTSKNASSKNTSSKNTLSPAVRRGRITYSATMGDKASGDSINNRDSKSPSMIIECFDYTPKPIVRLKVMYHNDIDYRYKYNDRTQLNLLLNTAKSAFDVDEIIIVKQGKVSDCTIGNLLFGRQGRWYTPNTPLLRGTQRQFLLDQGRIALADIGVDELKNYEKLMIINALNPFDERRALPIDCIIA